MVRHMKTGVAVVCIVGFGFAGAATREPETMSIPAIYVEGERPTASSFVVDMHDPLFTSRRDSVPVARRFDELRKGAASLLCTRNTPESSYTAVYEFVAPRNREMDLWVFEQGRAWASPFEWRMDTGPWRSASTRLPMEARRRLADDGPTFAWSRLGTLRIGRGKHRLTVRVTQPRGEGGQYLLAQDCFVLVAAEGEYEGRPFVYRHDAPCARSVLLWDSLPPGGGVDIGFRPWMDPYLLATDSAIGAVIVCPGGAYIGRAPSEGANVARRFNEEGLHAFVLYYRTAPHRHPAPFMDAARAVRTVRGRADEWNVREDRIALCGFSAGGHLAASVGVHFDKWRPRPAVPLDTVSARPDALILCYPVISSGALGHRRSFQNLLGETPPDDQLTLLSLELQVSRHTPPAFLWHTADDPVRVENSLLFAQALKAHDVPFEIHVFHQGGHGMNLAEKDPHVASWVRLCREWLADLGW